MCDVEKKEKIFGNKSLEKRNKDEIYFDNEIWNGEKNFSLFSNNGIIKERVLKKNHAVCIKRKITDLNINNTFINY